MGMPLKINNKIANRLDSDATVPHEPSHMDVHCLQRYNVLVCRVERVSELKLPPVFSLTPLYDFCEHALIFTDRK